MCMMEEIPVVFVLRFRLAGFGFGTDMLGGRTRCASRIPSTQLGWAAT